MINIKKTLVTLQNSAPGYYDRAAICDHIMQGHMAGTYARFNNPAEEVSAHFGVSLTGQIVQYVEMNRWAYANGVLENDWDLSLPWLVEAARKKINPNRRTISIEHEGNPGQNFSEAQYHASLELHKYIIQVWPTIKIDRKHIIGHYQISPHSRPDCPGDTFPFDRLITDLRREFNAMVNNPRRVPGDIDVRQEFTDFWFAHGGLPIFGYPLAPGLAVPDNSFGHATFIQFFERARFELQSDGSVMLGLVGTESRKLYLMTRKLV